MKRPPKIVPVVSALLLPFVTCALQWLLWDAFRPFVWFLFYPTVFFSSRIGGRLIGMVTTVVAALLVVYCFIPPELTFSGKNLNHLSSVLVFVAMGVLFSYTHERLERATQRASDAQDAARIAREQPQRARIELLQAEKQLAQESLVRSEERFRHLFTRAPVPLCFVTWDGAVTDLNGRFQQLFGYDSKQIPTLDRWWQAAYPDDGYRAWVFATWNEAVRKALETGDDIEPAEYRVTCSNGELRTVLISGIMLDGDLLASFFDTTERRLAEEEIRSLNACLERRVEERTAELRGANRELDAFAYAVAHDLRAPLRAMIGFSEALVEDYGAKLDGEARDYLEQIVLASRSMGGLIDGLLTLSRNTRGELRRERVDLSALACRIRSDLERGEPGRLVDWELACGVFGHGDLRMLEVVMRNLIGNAWKYTAHTDSPRICFRFRECDGRPLYAVEDNGAGFDMAHSERLFKPFQRLHRQDEFTGIGIGLATVQRIVHRHGGGIRAEGVPGKGAVFSFSLSNTTERETL